MKHLHTKNAEIYIKQKTKEAKNVCSGRVKLHQFSEWPFQSRLEWDLLFRNLMARILDFYELNRRLDMYQLNAYGSE